jgi:RNA polymerase sigma-70 factor (ECF subfamily)
VIQAIEPQEIRAGDGSITLNVQGTGFVSSSVVQCNGSALTTKFQNGSLAAALPASLAATTTTAMITVVNPGGLVSNALNFVVDEAGASSSQITQLLIQWSKGDQSAFDKLIPLIYKQLHRMAKRYMGQQRINHTLQPTALINEAYLRLVGKTWENRAHFFRVAATAMRQVLVDHARGIDSLKRGKGWQSVALDDAIIISNDRAGEMIALDDALRGLEKLNRRHSQVVELRYFGGMTVEETAECLGVAPATVMRDWRAAKAWLIGSLEDKR